MSHPLDRPVHTFHIPVMGTGFTIDTPLKVARFGISSVVSLVDDVLIEQMRRLWSRRTGREYTPIAEDADDARADRITAYLDMMHEIVAAQTEKLRRSAFTAGSEIVRYFEMLPPSPLRSLYERMQAATDPAEKTALQEELRREVRPGGIDVNIMTKLDRDRVRRGKLLPPEFADAMSALRGFARSRVRGSLVLSAGINRRLFGYLARFEDFLPDAAGELRKRVILKVNDFRSALVQGKLLARQGIWVSEFRLESGLNCGGHAFGGRGMLMGPALAEFRDRRDELRDQLHDVWRKALRAMGRPVPDEVPAQRLTAQGGIGTAAEDRFLRQRYGLDGTGWGSPFLLVPEVVNIDQEHLRRVCEAEEADVELSDASPLGVPFWSLRTSASERRRRQRIDEGQPGSPCPKGFLVSDTEFTSAPICTASRAYQRRKLAQLDAATDLSEQERIEQRRLVLAKSCICNDLAGGATGPAAIDPLATTAVCCGPNTVYFTRPATLAEMIDHIYGRAALPLAARRPHMLLKELSLHVQRLWDQISRRRGGVTVAAADAADSLRVVRENLQRGIQHYRILAGSVMNDRRDAFLQKLSEIQAELEQLTAPRKRQATHG